MTEQTDGDDDVAFKGEPLLCFYVLLLELRAAAEGYYFVFADHGLVAVVNDIIWFLPVTIFIL